MTMTFTDWELLFEARSGSSDGSSLQLEAGTLVVITVPAGDPTRLTGGEHSAGSFEVSAGDGSELETLFGAVLDGLITRNGVGEDV